jgi:hypothetical protein
LSYWSKAHHITYISQTLGQSFIHQSFFTKNHKKLFSLFLLLSLLTWQFSTTPPP